MNSVYVGKQLTGAADKLIKVPLDYLYNRIKNPKPDFEAKIRNLRIVRNIDANLYAMQKRMLPYIVCSVFNPPFRRTENFAYTEFFFVDIDHISQKGFDVNTLRKELEQDKRIVMSFISPSEDGLKILFHLQERCYDHGIYSLFYKTFVHKLSDRYNLEQIIDSKTSDVCRACFLSEDADVYFNPDAEQVNINDYINMSSPTELFDLKKSEEAKIKKDNESAQQEPKIKDPDEESISKIKEILKLKKQAAEKPPAYVPEQLNDIIDDLRTYIENTGIIVSEILNISYAKKIRMTMGQKQSEINVFFGKRGYSVVISPRCGTDNELNEVTHDLICSFLNENGLL